MKLDLKIACRDALTASASELAATTLGSVLLAVECGHKGDAAASGYGAYLGLLVQDEPIQVGLVAEPEGCQVLAKALFGMEPADEDLPISDVSDAMCEIINIVAGGLKRRVHEQVAVSLGLPIFVAGPPLPGPQQEVVAQQLSIGSVPVRLVILTQKQQAAPLSRRANGVQTAGVNPAEEQGA